MFFKMKFNSSSKSCCFGSPVIRSSKLLFPVSSVRVEVTRFRSFNSILSTDSFNSSLLLLISFSSEVPSIFSMPCLLILNPCYKRLTVLKEIFLYRESIHFPANNLLSFQTHLATKMLLEHPFLNQSHGFYILFRHCHINIVKNDLPFLQTNKGRADFLID